MDFERLWTLYPPNRRQIADKEDISLPPKSESHSKWSKMPPQDTLDLHGYFREEAREALVGFIRSMRERGFRKGLIIHGKGLHSSSGSILMPMVRGYLENSTEIGDFGKATGKHGGAGATWFILR